MCVLPPPLSQSIARVSPVFYSCTFLISSENSQAYTSAVQYAQRVLTGLPTNMLYITGRPNVK